LVPVKAATTNMDDGLEPVANVDDVPVSRYCEPLKTNACPLTVVRDGWLDAVAWVSVFPLPLLSVTFETPIGIVLGASASYQAERSAPLISRFVLSDPDGHKLAYGWPVGS
jgi:hypothetical protein